MLQRIQSIYLVAGLICTGLLFYFPVWSSGDHTGLEIYGAGSHIILFIITSLLGLIQFTSVFLFRNRKLQITLCWLGLLIAASFISLFLIFFIQDNQGMNNFTKGIKIGALLPILIIIFKYLAIKNIQKDEDLIKSMNRLR